MSPQLLIHVPPHPLIKNWLAIARSATTPPGLFKTAIVELGKHLTYEAIRDWLPIVETTVQTPLADSPATFINTEVPIAVVPILRAGLVLLEGAQTMLPITSVYHIGIARNEETLEPHCYLNKLPPSFLPQTRVLITEPMLATGGTIMMTMGELTDRGVDPSLVRIISVVAAPLALQQLGKHYPNLQIYTATIDEEVNSQGFIVPGLGDAGDRSFGT